MDGEEWRPVVGWEGLYEVSSHGRVRRVSIAGNRKPGGFLKGSLNSRGYPTVGLCRDAKHHGRRVHQLVCEAFHGPKQRGMVVNHKNGVRTDNRRENLEWVTIAENNLHSYRVNKRSPVMHRAKLNAEQVVKIRVRYRLLGLSKDDIAREFGVTRENIHAIVTGISWKNLPMLTGDYSNLEKT